MNTKARKRKTYRKRSNRTGRGNSPVHVGLPVSPQQGPVPEGIVLVGSKRGRGQGVKRTKRARGKPKRNRHTHHRK